MSALIDPFNRKISYLRVSVTDHCNYRCYYCRDDEHKIYTQKSSVLNYEEIARIVKIFSELGVSKVRLTGGEPLLRRDIIKLVEMLNNIDGINDIPLSTNAHLLASMAGKLKNAGLNRANISIDSLDNARFAKITRGGDLQKVIQGIDSAIAVGMTPIKLNMVVAQGVNDDEIEAMLDFAIKREIDMRFIETMPIGVAGINASSAHYSEAQIMARVEKHLPNKLSKIKSHYSAGPARNFFVSGTNTTVGVISAVSNNFCQSCNRVRLSAKGRLLLCLGQNNSVSLRDALRSGMNDDEMKNIILKAIDKKPLSHEFDTNINNISTSQMVEIGG